jgi:hypothetical protein
MEDVLEVFHRPYDPARPQVCLDETSKQLVAESRPSIPMRRGQCKRMDPEYHRCGVASVFMLSEALAVKGEAQLRYVLEEYLQYYHHERFHKALGRIIEPIPEYQDVSGKIVCVERLGGLLKSYHRRAA